MPMGAPRRLGSFWCPSVIYTGSSFDGKSRVDGDYGMKSKLHSVRSAGQYKRSMKWLFPTGVESVKVNK